MISLSLDDDTLRTISSIFGWVYFFAWSISFYPQIWVNYKLKSVEGYHLDYPFLNFSGYIFYSTCCTFGFFWKNNHYGMGTIAIQDLVFAYHSFCMAVVLGLQCIYYQKGANKLSDWAKWYIVFAWSAVGAVFLVTEVFKWIEPSENFNIVIFLGYLKVSISLIKYLPAVYWNYARKSTEGFSISGVLLDLAGGVFSIAQNLIQVEDGDTPNINPIKFALGNVTIIYDVIFVLQHYVFYNKSRMSKKMDDTDSFSSNQHLRSADVLETQNI